MALVANIHGADNNADRNLGEKWERNFCLLAAEHGKSFTPMQIGRKESIQAFFVKNNKWKLRTLPDIIVWTWPGEHHEIKHKSPYKPRREPNNKGEFGLEVYRFEALLWFARETQQDVMYTIHNHALSGGRNCDLNRLKDWLTVRVVDLEKRWRGPFPTGSYVDGKMKKVPTYFWSIDLWQPLSEFWHVK